VEPFSYEIYIHYWCISIRKSQQNWNGNRAVLPGAGKVWGQAPRFRRRGREKRSHPSRSSSGSAKPTRRKKARRMHPWSVWGYSRRMPGPPAFSGPPAQLPENLVSLALSDGASNDDRPRDGSSHSRMWRELGQHTGHGSGTLKKRV